MSSTLANARQSAPQAASRAVPDGEFAPTAMQKQLLAAFVAATESAADVAELCRAIAIAPREFHAWLRDDEFAEWWADQSEAVIRAERVGVFRALTRKAHGGDLAAIKVWLQRFDRLDAGQSRDIDAYRKLLERFARRAGIEQHPYRTDADSDADAEFPANADFDSAAADLFDDGE